MASAVAMDALRWHAAGDLRLESQPVPERPPGMTLVEVRICGICGTDIREYQAGPAMIGTRPHPLTGQVPPVTLGHEFCGVVVDCDEDAALGPGTRVTADACWRCNECSSCLAGDYHRCRYGGSIGLHSDGAFARFVVVPDYCLVAVLDGVSDRAAAMTEPLAVALHGLQRGSVLPGDDVLVLGFGPIGATAALIARALGARPWVVELVEPRARVAAELGFELITAGDELPRRVRAALGSGGADIVAETTGSPALLAEAIESATRGGRIVQLGMSSRPAEIATERLVLFERSLVGSLGYRHDLPKVMQMMADGVLDPEPVIGDVVLLADAAAAFAELAAGPSPQIKTMVEIGA